MTIRPIVEKTETHLIEGKRGNFSLYFPRMVCWHDEDESKMKDKDCIVNLSKGAEPRFSAAQPALERIHDRQKKLLLAQTHLGVSAFEFRAKLVSPYVSGLGSGHPTETGMILDRNSGLPFIPASGIKGVLRLAHALNRSESADLDKNRYIRQGSIDKSGRFRAGAGDQWELDDKEPTMRKYFGDTETKPGNVRGQLVFLDAYPAAIPALKVDIMNPHFASYYGGKNPPLETESPVPIKFLAVKEGTEFVFRGYVSKLAEPEVGRVERDPVSRSFTDDDITAITAMFRRGLEQIGMGAKTAVGYGRFANVTETLAAEVAAHKEQEETKKEEQERIATAKAKDDAIIREKQKIEEEKRRKAAEEAQREEEYLRRLAEVSNDKKSIAFALVSAERCAQDQLVSLYLQHLANTTVLDESLKSLAVLIAKRIEKPDKNAKQEKKDRYKRIQDLAKP